MIVGFFLIILVPTFLYLCRIKGDRVNYQQND